MKYVLVAISGYASSVTLRFNTMEAADAVSMWLTGKQGYICFITKDEAPTPAYSAD